MGQVNKKVYLLFHITAIIRCLQNETRGILLQTVTTTLRNLAKWQGRCITCEKVKTPQLKQYPCLRFLLNVKLKKPWLLFYPYLVASKGLQAPWHLISSCHYCIAMRSPGDSMRSPQTRHSSALFPDSALASLRVQKFRYKS